MKLHDPNTDSHKEVGATNGSEHAYPHMKMSNGTTELAGGLSKREYFAAMAMQGFVTKNIIIIDYANIHKYRASWATHQADALIEQLNKE